MQFSYTPSGVCAQQILFQIEGGIVKGVSFAGGCNGNGNGISKLVDGMAVDDVVSKLSGVNCGGRGTSCPDQLARALQAAAKEANA